MTRPTNDLVIERWRRLAYRQQRREAFQQAAEEIYQDRSFPKVLQWVAKEALWLQNQQYSNEGNNLTTFRDAQSILQTLAEGDGDSEAFSALESESDSEQSVQSNYRSNHDTLDDPREGDSEHTPIETL